MNWRARAQSPIRILNWKWPKRSAQQRHSSNNNMNRERRRKKKKREHLYNRMERHAHLNHKTSKGYSILTKIYIFSFFLLLLLLRVVVWNGKKAYRKWEKKMSKNIIVWAGVRAHVRSAPKQAISHSTPITTSTSTAAAIKPTISRIQRATESQPGTARMFVHEFFWRDSTKIRRQFCEFF